MILKEKMMTEWTNEWMNQWKICERVNEWTSERPNQWLNEAINELMNQSMNQWIRESMNEPMNGVNQGRKERMNEWMSFFFFFELPIRWAKSSLSRLFTEVPLHSYFFSDPLLLLPPSLSYIFSQLITSSVASVTQFVFMQPLQCVLHPPAATAKSTRETLCSKTSLPAAVTIRLATSSCNPSWQEHSRSATPTQPTCAQHWQWGAILRPVLKFWTCFREIELSLQSRALFCDSFSRSRPTPAETQPPLGDPGARFHPQIHTPGTVTVIYTVSLPNYLMMWLTWWRADYNHDHSSVTRKFAN